MGRLMIVEWNGERVLRCWPTGLAEVLKTRFQCGGPAERGQSAGSGEVPEHYPQPAGTRPNSSLGLLRSMVISEATSPVMRACLVALRAGWPKTPRKVLAYGH